MSRFKVKVDLLHNIQRDVRTTLFRVSQIFSIVWHGDSLSLPKFSASLLFPYNIREKLPAFGTSFIAFIVIIIIIVIIVVIILRQQRHMRFYCESILLVWNALRRIRGKFHSKTSRAFASDMINCYCHRHYRHNHRHVALCYHDSIFPNSFYLPNKNYYVSCKLYRF